MVAVICDVKAVLVVAGYAIPPAWLAVNENRQTVWTADDDFVAGPVTLTDLDELLLRFRSSGKMMRRGSFAPKL